MMFNRIKILLVALASVFVAEARVNYDVAFSDSTLRLDYSLAGNATTQNVFLSNASIDTAPWAGRRVNLDHFPLQGNGRVRVTDATSGETLYTTAFSSLFSEWIDTPEAESVSRAMEHTVLVPMPRRPVDILVTLTNIRHDTVAVLRHRVDPADILLRRPAPGAEVTPHEYLHQAGKPSECIDVAIVAEGYTEAEMPQFLEKARRTVDAILSHKPFGDMAQRFNFVAVKAPSLDSGVSVPRLGEWRRTAVGSHYSTFYSNRYLTTPRVWQLHDLLRGIPYEHIVILANTPEYGGGGIFNSYTLTTTGHAAFEPVVVHEFGHSFGGLGDEYFYDNDTMTDVYPRDIEPWEPNVTTTLSGNLKWGHLMAPGTPVPTPVERAEEFPVGIYEGAAYCTKGLYRPADHCRMRDNATPGFCPVCQESLKKLILFYTDEQNAEL